MLLKFRRLTLCRRFLFRPVPAALEATMSPDDDDDAICAEAVRLAELFVAELVPLKTRSSEGGDLGMEPMLLVGLRCPSTWMGGRTDAE